MQHTHHETAVNLAQMTLELNSHSWQYQRFLQGCALLSVCAATALCAALSHHCEKSALHKDRPSHCAPCNMTLLSIELHAYKCVLSGITDWTSIRHISRHLCARFQHAAAGSLKQWHQMRLPQSLACAAWHTAAAAADPPPHLLKCAHRPGPASRHISRHTGQLSTRWLCARVVSVLS